MKEFDSWLCKLEKLSYFKQNTLERLMTPKQHIGPPYLLQLESRIEEGMEEFKQLLDIFMIFEQLVMMIDLKDQDYSLSIDKSIQRLAVYQSSSYSDQDGLEGTFKGLISDYDAFMAAKVNYSNYNRQLRQLAEGMLVSGPGEESTDASELM